MCTYKSQRGLQNTYSYDNSTFVSIFFTHTNCHSCLNDIFMDRSESMSPFLADEHDHKQPNHFKFLNKHILATDHGLIIQKILNGIFPFLTSCAFLCVVIHDIVSVKFNHFLDSHDDEIGLFELTEEFL